MLRIDEKSGTLVAPQASAFVTESAPDREELLALVIASWEAFAGEIEQSHLRFAAAAPAPDIDALAFDEAAGRVVVVQVEDVLDEAAAGRALAAAAEVSGWDATALSAVHETLQAAVPGDSPQLVVVAARLEERAVRALDWLRRRPGVDVEAFAVSALRFGSERLLSVRRELPAREATAGDPAAEVQRLLGEVGTATVGHSAPPPGLQP